MSSNCEVLATTLASFAVLDVFFQRQRIFLAIFERGARGLLLAEESARRC
jgi:hypothetical protein